MRRSRGRADPARRVMQGESRRSDFQNWPGGRARQIDLAALNGLEST